MPGYVDRNPYAPKKMARFDAGPAPMLLRGCTRPDSTPSFVINTDNSVDTLVTFQCDLAVGCRLLPCECFILFSFPSFMNTVGVNHVSSQPSKRRDGGSARTDVLPRTKRHKPCAAASPPVVPPVLDPPSSAHTRVAQRQKMIAKGKNTAGYDAYRRQVPVEQRRPRSMDTPSTPDVHRDVPNKRWQGLVRAWYVVICWLRE